LKKIEKSLEIEADDRSIVWNKQMRYNFKGKTRKQDRFFGRCRRGL